MTAVLKLHSDEKEPQKRKKRKAKVKRKFRPRNSLPPVFTKQQFKDLDDKLEAWRQANVTKLKKMAMEQQLDEAAVARMSGIRSVQTVTRLWNFTTISPHNNTILKMAWGLGAQLAIMTAKKAKQVAAARTKLAKTS